MSSLSLLSACTFKQDPPLHCPHAVVHKRPFFRQVHDSLSHFPLQLKLIVLKSCSRAASFDILKGTKPEGDADHPQFSGGRLLPRHICTWWYVRSYGTAQHPQWAGASQEARILRTLLLSLEIYQTVRMIDSMQSRIHI